MINDQTIAEIKKRLTDAAAYRTFFEEIQSPEWLLPLDRSGFFLEPEPPLIEEVDFFNGEKTSAISYPHWPASRYLVRMAKLGVREALSVLERIPETENIAIKADIFEVLSCFSTVDTRELLLKQATWLKDQQYFNLYIPQKAVDLILHVLNEDAELAINLVRSLFSIKIEPRDIENPSRGSEEVARMDTWLYGDLLRRLAVAFVKRHSILLSEFAISELASIVTNTIIQTTHKTSSNDLSSIWRPAIEESEQNIGWDLRSGLIVALRETGNVLTKEWPEQLPKFIQTLDQQRWPIFRRISCYLLSNEPELHPDLVRAHILDQSSFESHNMRHEYVALVKSAFKFLDQGGKDVFWEWVEREGDDSDSRKLNWYYSLRSDLNAHQQSTLEELRSKRGDPEHFEYPKYVETQIGFKSPISADELLTKTIPEIVTLLNDWQSSSDFMGPSKEGLGEQLQIAVSSKPDYFLSELRTFSRLHDPFYVTRLLRGFEDALKAGRSFEPDSVLQFALVTCNRREEPLPRRDAFIDEDLDPDWSWCSVAILDYVRAVIERQSISPSAADLSCQIVETLINDANPTENQEVEALSLQDPFTFSLNSVRGKALNILIDLTRSLAKQNIRETFDIRILKLLDGHLQDSEKSLAVHSVYGAYLNHLIVWYPDWIKENISRILPLEKDEARFEAAWHAYLTYARPWSGSLDVLILFYQFMVSKKFKGKTKSYQRSPFDIGDAIARHFAVFVLERSDWNSDQEILKLFFKNMKAKHQAELWRHLGRSISIYGKQYPDDLKTRLKGLWDWRANHNISKDELKTFGWWSSSDVFPSEWTLPHLTMAFQAGNIEHLEENIQYLSDQVSNHPSECLKTTIAFIKSVPNPFTLPHFTPMLHQILEVGKNAAPELTDTSVDLLIANGLNEFLKYSSKST
jgi:hypothetical protein